MPATELKGWVFLNSDVVNAVGYSGKPIRIAIGIDTHGVITGAKLVEHHEPIVLVGIPPEKIEALIARFAGQNMLEPAPAGQKLDIISGATVTVMVIDDSIRGSAQRMAHSRAQPAAAAAPARRRSRPSTRRCPHLPTGRRCWPRVRSPSSG